jgi:hypothetical protein
MTDVKFDIIARDRASSTFDKVGGSASRAGEKLAHLAKYAALGVGALGVGAVAAGAKFAKMAIDDAAGVAKLSLALKNNAGATKGQIAQTESWITAQGKSLGVTDDELRPALGRLARLSSSPRWRWTSRPAPASR